MFNFPGTCLANSVNWNLASVKIVYATCASDAYPYCISFSRGSRLPRYRGDTQPCSTSNDSPKAELQ